MGTIDDTTLARIEKENAHGLTSAALLDLFSSFDVQLSEATLRKYVQMGLLPRSVRVGSKGKHQGSKGLYPVSVVRQILQIKRDFLFMRGEMDQLQHALRQLWKRIAGAVRERRSPLLAEAVERDLGEVRVLSKELLQRLSKIESRLMAGAKLRQVSAL
jgi:hypothetical protein